MALKKKIKVFFEIPRKITGACREQNHGKEIKYKLAINTAVHPMYAYGW